MQLGPTTGELRSERTGLETQNVTTVNQSHSQLWIISREGRSSDLEWQSLIARGLTFSVAHLGTARSSPSCLPAPRPACLPACLPAFQPPLLQPHCCATSSHRPRSVVFLAPLRCFRNHPSFTQKHANTPTPIESPATVTSRERTLKRKGREADGATGIKPHKVGHLCEFFLVAGHELVLPVGRIKISLLRCSRLGVIYIARRGFIITNNSESADATTPKPSNSIY